MKRILTSLALFGAAAALAVLYTGKVRATPATSGFAGTTLAVGRFEEVDVFNRLKLEEVADRFKKHKKNVWQSIQRTKGDSDLYIQSNVWQPGADTGWHTHPGHSLIIVTAGKVMVYEGDDPSCTPTEYSAGTGFVDEGGEHVHIIRNETGIPASTIAAQLLPAGAARRIDAPDPGNCHF